MATPQNYFTRFRCSSAVSRVVAAMAARFAQRSGYSIVNQNPQPLSSSSRSNCSFKCRRAAFLIARRSSATPCFSARRSRRVRGSTDCDTCRILGRRAPMFRSFGFAYGSMRLEPFIRDEDNRNRSELNNHEKNCLRPESICRKAVRSVCSPETMPTPNLGSNNHATRHACCLLGAADATVLFFTASSFVFIGVHSWLQNENAWDHWRPWP